MMSSTAGFPFKLAFYSFFALFGLENHRSYLTSIQVTAGYSIYCHIRPDLFSRLNGRGVSRSPRILFRLGVYHVTIVSADVWSHPLLFSIGSRRRLKVFFLLLSIVLFASLLEKIDSVVTHELDDTKWKLKDNTTINSLFTNSGKPFQQSIESSVHHVKEKWCSGYRQSDYIDDSLFRSAYRCTVLHRSAIKHSKLNRK